MRREDDLAGLAEDLLDLGRVAVLANVIGLDVLVRIAEVRLGIAALAGTGDAALGVDDDEALGPTGANGGRGGDGGRRGIAAGAADEGGLARSAEGTGALDILGEELGKAEGARREELGRGVLGAVPLLVDALIRQAIVSGEVDHGHARVKQRGRLSHGSGVRHGEEGEVAALDRRVVVRGEHEVRRPRERGIDVSERSASVGV